MPTVRQHLVLARMGGAAWEDVVTVLATLLGRHRDNGPAWHVTPPGDSAVGTVSGVSIVSILSIVSTLAQSQFPGAGIKEAANLGPARATTPSLSAQY